MNERFLFRGKRVDNLKKDWVIGHYVSVPRHMIVLAETTLSGNWNCFDVDPSTIGQCTGLKAKNGRLIYEGDIANYRRSSTYTAKNAIIQWSETDAMFEIKYEHGEDYITDSENELEIIGNIHDNPELLDKEAHP